ACGLPVLSTHAASVAELVQDGRNGRLVPPDDPAALAAALAELLTRPELRQAYGRVARGDVVVGFDSGRGIERIAGLLDAALGRGGASTSNAASERGREPS
ncbi:glycosyltransferase, partial [Geminicoccus harenae]